MARVVLESLNKFYQASRKSERVYAVSDLNLEIQDGEFLALVGPSGCGKSTTLRLIAGLEDISSGHIRIGDRIVDAIEPKDRDIAMVFQNYALYPHMSVAENMAFGLQLRKLPRAEIESRVGSAATLLGLGELLQRLPKELSGGQRQRVAVGRAIVRQPQVFLFDEPLSNLDAQMRLQMRGELSRLHHQLRATMVYVTHDQAEAMTLGDRIAVMKEGRLQQVADPITLYRHPTNRFVASFMGSPPMNFFNGRIANDEKLGRVFLQSTTDGTEGFRLAVSDAFEVGRPMVLGLRPEHVGIDNVAGTAALQGRVELVEMTGAETFLHLNCSGDRCVARTPSAARYDLGSLVRVFAQAREAHFFDPEIGASLSL